MSKGLSENGKQFQSEKNLLPSLSLDSYEDVVKNRRGFLTFLFSCSVALFIATLPFARRFLYPKEESFPKVALGKVEEVPLGESRSFTYPGKENPALLIHLPNGQWRAYGGMCTHLGCVVYWDITSERVICPCHNAAFSSDTGEVLMGPPRRGLSRIDLSIENDNIYAIGMKL